MREREEREREKRERARRERGEKPKKRKVQTLVALHTPAEGREAHPIHIHIHLKQEGRVLTRDESSGSDPGEPPSSSVATSGRRWQNWSRLSSSSSSSSSGPSAREGNTDRPPTSSSTMPSRLSVSAASRAAFSSSICRGRQTHTGSS